MKNRSVIAFLFAVVLAFATISKTKSLGSPDFKVFYTAAQYALHDPGKIYRDSPDRYLYPPSTAILLAPFAWSKNYVFHQWVWHGFLAILLFLLARSSWTSFFALLVLTRYLTITFFYGQMNLVLLGLFALMEWQYFRVSLGFFWTLASFIKVYPLALFPIFWRRDLKPFMVACLCALFFLALPFLRFGVSQGFVLYEDFLFALKDKGMPLHSHNQSIAAILLRLFSGESFQLHSVAEVRWTLIELPRYVVQMAALTIGAILSVVSWKKAWNQPKKMISAGAFSILFLSHIVWKDYLLFLFFPLKELFAQNRKKALLVGGLFLGLATISSPDIVGFPISTRLDAASVHLLGAILVWIMWML